MTATVLAFPRRTPPHPAGPIAGHDELGHDPLRPGDPVIVRHSGLRCTLESISDAAEYGLNGRMVAIVRTADGRLVPAWPNELARDPSRPRQP